MLLVFELMKLQMQYCEEITSLISLELVFT